MNNLPQVYRKYDLLFTPHLIPQLRNLRGKQWANVIDRLTKLPETHPEAIAFAKMMVDLGNCLSCEMDNYRAQRGCALCSQQTITAFKGNDEELINLYKEAQQQVDEFFADMPVQKVA